MQKVACKACGALILPVTAQKTGGECIPCKSGTRAAIEHSKSYYIEERELDRTDPERLYWKALVARVHGPSGGFEKLSEPEKKYFATCLLLGEVFNGGFEQYFFNHSGEYFVVVSQTLLELGAQRALRLLRQAKNILFGTSAVPVRTPTRRRYLASHPINDHEALDELDKEFWSDPDDLHEKLSAFAKEHGLLCVAA